MTDTPKAVQAKDVVPKKEKAKDVVPKKEKAKDVVPKKEKAKDVVPKKEKAKDVVPKAVNDEKTSRQQISRLIGINLSVSRVRKHVDKNNVNVDIESACTELKALLALETEGKTPDFNTVSDMTNALVERAYSQIYDVRKNKYNTLKERLSAGKNAGDAKKLTMLGEFPVKTETLTEKIEYVSKLRCRFSNDASVVLSSVLDYVVQDLVRTAMIHARKSGKAIIQVQHVVQCDFKSVSVYPMVNTLDVVQKALQVDHPDDDCDDDKTDNTEEDDEKHESTFEFYINLICKSVKNKLVESDESYNTIRISKHIRKFCSDVVIQLIERISPLIKLYSTTAKVKTVNDDVIMFIFKFLMLDAGGCPNELCTFVQERIHVYREIKHTDK
jgi:histone H3/H4